MHVVDREPAPATKRAPRRVKATATATLRTMKLTRMVTRRVRAQKVKEKDKNAGQDSIAVSRCMFVLFTVRQPYATLTARARSGNCGRLHRIYSVTPARRRRRQGRRGDR